MARNPKEIDIMCFIEIILALFAIGIREKEDITLEEMKGATHLFL